MMYYCFLCGPHIFFIKGSLLCPANYSYRLSFFLLDILVLTFLLFSPYLFRSLKNLTSSNFSSNLLPYNSFIIKSYILYFWPVISFNVSIFLFISIFNPCCYFNPEIYLPHYWISVLPHSRLRFTSFTFNVIK